MWYCCLLVFALAFIWIRPLQGAIQLPPYPPAMTAMDWEGMDDEDGDGSESFTSLGDRIRGRLRILCNYRPGYQLTLTAQNATRKKWSELKQGGHALTYRAKMNTSGVRFANITRKRLVLNDPGNPSLIVNFYGGLLPMDGNNPLRTNVVDLTFRLQDFQGKLVPMGTYTDVITATLSLN